MNLRRAMLFSVPIALLGGAGFGGWYAWRAMFAGSNMRGTPSILSGRRIPGFRLPGLGGEGIQATDIFNGGKPLLVHFWASWSQPCIVEQPVLLQLKAAKVTVWGIAYKDKVPAALAFLEREGNPYARNAIDEPGRIAYDWGVANVPETFLVDGDGYVRWHINGPLQTAMIEEQILPLIRKYEA
ncbi:MAG: DsbE family thiol:disulfide interchange protein [Acetobacteraceae bacterium]|nr:DsbE family thiol:disulfide interchange protein [Acetobacteraceae bacterium]